MDKGRKLRRYSRKDYSQLVDFPVEIVGRDGVVRRYSFEESVRLYQRRIASAELRYDDGEVVQAEVKHCRRRIDQIRRSYFVRYGWAAIQVVDTPDLAEAGIAGEVAAFLRRCFDGTDVNPETAEVSLLSQAGPQKTFFVRHGGRDDASYLLYLYRFDAVQTGGGAREAFGQFLRVLESVRGSSDAVEALLAWHQTADCGLILTGQGADARVQFDPNGMPGGGDLPWMDHRGATDDPLHQGMVLLRRGERASALRAFSAAYEANHYRRAAYVGAAVVADQLGRHDEAETAALMGTRYFSDDPLLRYHLVLARLRQGDGAGAREALGLLQASHGESPPVILAGALADLLDGQPRAGRRALSTLARGWARDDPDLLRAMRHVRALLLARMVLFVAAGIVGVLGVSVALSFTPWGLLLTALGAVMLVVSEAAWRRQFRRLLSAPGSEGMRLANPAALRVDVPTPQDLQ